LKYEYKEKYGRLSAKEEITHNSSLNHANVRVTVRVI